MTDIGLEEEIVKVINGFPRLTPKRRALPVALEPALSFGFRKLARQKLEAEANLLRAFPPDELRDRLRARVAPITYDWMQVYYRLMQGVATYAGGNPRLGPRVPRWIESEIREALYSKIKELIRQRSVLAANLPSGMAARKPIRRSHKYESIDAELRKVAEMHPKNHEEVFRNLDGRAPTPEAKPFKNAGGWLAGFRHDKPAARAWLSKAWCRLNLPPFARGPKKLLQ